MTLIPDLTNPTDADETTHRLVVVDHPDGTRTAYGPYPLPEAHDVATRLCTEVLTETDAVIDVTLVPHFDHPWG